MWARLLRFKALPSPAKGLFLRALFLLPVLTCSLRFRGFGSTQKSLQNLLPTVSTPVSGPTAKSCVELTSRMVLAAAHLSPFPSTCLERSLALWWLLARQGISAQLRIGVRKDAARFQAHAWVENDGAAIGEPDGSHLHYAAFAEEFSGELP